MIDELTPRRKGGVTFYPAEALPRIFDWASEQRRTIEWAEGLFYRPETDEGQLSIAYIAERKQGDPVAFRECCLGLARQIAEEAADKQMGGYFELGISD